MHPIAVIVSYGDPVLWVEDGQSESARGQLALPGTLRQAEVGAHSHLTGQCDVLSQYSGHMLWNQDLIGPHTWRHTTTQEMNEQI